MPEVAAKLPGLDERPGAWVLIYDGQCRFCRANVAVLRALDGGRIAYVSLHDPVVRQRWPELSFEQLMEQIYLIDDKGQKHPGAAALRYLSRKLAALWILAPLLHIPGSLPLWQFCYRRIAQIRYRFGKVESCEGGTCSVHFGGKKST